MIFYGYVLWRAMAGHITARTLVLRLLTADYCRPLPAKYCITSTRSNLLGWRSKTTRSHESLLAGFPVLEHAIALHITHCSISLLVAAARGRDSCGSHSHGECAVRRYI
jgi:hypothetical protein